MGGELILKTPAPPGSFHISQYTKVGVTRRLLNFF
jgi:hypothetical protein